MMKLSRTPVIGAVLLAAVLWSFASAEKPGPDSGAEPQDDYPNAHLLATPSWLEQHLEDDKVVILDVRGDEHFDGRVIPGAIRLPWSSFRTDREALLLGGTFVGVGEAQEILGGHGVTRDDTVVLYDSVERDGGATSSYVFWVLDVLGHEKKKILPRGIDAWVDAGYETADAPAQPTEVVYEAPLEEIARRKVFDGEFVRQRLGDPHYQIIDVRSSEEYLGEKGSKGLTGEPLKLGHIPGALNINYESAWVDAETKQIKPYAELRQIYQGVSAERPTIVYCASGRRSSFSYFILRLMGFADPLTYEPSWMEWGLPSLYFPVELEPNEPAGDALPGSGELSAGTVSEPARESEAPTPEPETTEGGYMSCGG